jgi:hypothetical protein
MRTTKDSKPCGTARSLLAFAVAVKRGIKSPGRFARYGYDSDWSAIAQERRDYGRSPWKDFSPFQRNLFVIISSEDVWNLYAMINGLVQHHSSRLP